MSSLSIGVANAVAVHNNDINKLRLNTRGLGGSNQGALQHLSKGQIHALQALACTFSGFSVASSMLALLWFIKMRRTFRHDLVMLLVQSDMFKAVWFMVYPIVVFARGGVPPANSSTFCQVSGFFLSWAIEASDFSALMIALHTALYIFRPQSSRGEGGLYPYRRLAYTLYFLLPILSASLAFLNKEDAFVADGTYCYLPVRPFWYRIALAWIPRYTIFVTILGVYAAIYYYVRHKLNNFSRNVSENSAQVDASSNLDIPAQSGLRTVPDTPQLRSHGLIDPSPHASVVDDARRPSVSTTIDVHPRMRARVGAHRFIWGSFSVADVPPPSPPLELAHDEIDSFNGPSTPHPLPTIVPGQITPQLRASTDTESPMVSRATSWRDVFVRRFSPRGTEKSKEEHSMVDIMSVLRKHPDSSENQTPIRLVNSRGQLFAEAEVIRSRDNIQRQLRYLFIYPMVYIGMWIVPFASHVLQYDDTLATRPPFGLACASTFFICSQAAVDSWLFSTREKPWKQIPGTDGSFWESLKPWSGWSHVAIRKGSGGPGKTKEEMTREARAAYRRRDEEMAARRVDSYGSIGSPIRRGERSWWELERGDAMSPVTEEANPMEDGVDPLDPGVSSQNLGDDIDPFDMNPLHASTSRATTHVAATGESRGSDQTAEDVPASKAASGI